MEKREQPGMDFAQFDGVEYEPRVIDVAPSRLSVERLIGGILALLLFGVMLTPPDMEERSLMRVLPGLGIVGAATAWVAWEVARNVEWATASEPLDGNPGAVGEGTAEAIGIGFLAIDQYVVAFELAAVVLTVALVAAVYIARRKKADLEPELADQEVR